jgi:yeast amino acid transporter
VLTLNTGLGSGGASQAFAWLLNLSTIAGLIAWATLSFCYIRFYRALQVQGVSRDTFPWKSPLQPYAAWVGFVGSTVILLIAGFPVFLKNNWDTSNFIASYIGIPIFIVPIIAWKLINRTKLVRAADMDLWSGRLMPEDSQ